MGPLGSLLNQQGLAQNAYYEEMLLRQQQEAYLSQQRGLGYSQAKPTDNPVLLLLDQPS